jgi:hypothetical protein
VAFDEAIRLDPEDAVVWNNKCKILEALDSTSETNTDRAKAESWDFVEMARGVLEAEEIMVRVAERRS